MSTLGLYPEELDLENVGFQWPARTKIQRVYHNFLKKNNDYRNLLRCLDLLDINFEVLSSSIALDKLDVECAENVEAKPTGNDSGFIKY